ncbi:abnormal spindle-like microcephaly-associated protein homolog [Drosophila subpulchrella]|uniref:abnormal spindle-like microcephaly-associated protein homolog n=1 Tax=Drosophila subpulchrella TaxID=1486046 RepID=UPI0018A12B14|nr:abnormal spindle-like microcephaly-associated protein homolog [Drosophila subpulchrella]
MYIYPSSPESASSLQSEESAAIKIQAGFRGYRVRKEIHRSSKSANPRQSNPHTRRSQRQRPKNNALMENQANTGKPHPTADDPQSENGGKSVEDRCATKIQAGFRGFLVRKKQKIATDAAVKIQAGFRGFKTRKELKQCEPIV